MTTKQFLRKFKIGTSAIQNVTLKDVNTEVFGRLTKEMLMDDDYLDWGNTKINSFTITDKEILLYVESR